MRKSTTYGYAAPKPTLDGGVIWRANNKIVIRNIRLGGNNMDQDYELLFPYDEKPDEDLVRGDEFAEVVVFSDRRVAVRTRDEFQNLSALHYVTDDDNPSFDVFVITNGIAKRNSIRIRKNQVTIIEWEGRVIRKKMVLKAKHPDVIFIEESLIL